MTKQIKILAALLTMPLNSSKVIEGVFVRHHKWTEGIYIISAHYATDTYDDFSSNLFDGQFYMEADQADFYIRMIVANREIDAERARG